MALLGGTRLFRLYHGDGAAALHFRLGQAGILTRAFAGEPAWLRFGLPGDEAGWARLGAALAGCGKRQARASPSTHWGQRPQTPIR
jgi:cobalamin biosynthetic protein CobC